MMENRSEKGQVMILLIIALVGLFAFAALAIDGAVIYSDRRIAQNAADASALSGAGAVGQELKKLGGSATYLNWDCPTLESLGVLEAGNDAADAHAGVVDFDISNGNISDNNGVITECFKLFNGTYYETFIDVFVKITDATPTSFLHLISEDTIENEVEVKTRVYPMTEAGYGMTLLALHDEGHCNDGIGLEIKGGPKVDIEVGGIVSNSWLKISGTGSEDSGVWVDDGVINYKYDDEDCYKESGSPTVSPAPTEGVGIPDPDIDEPICDSLPELDYPKKESDNPMVPGKYGSPKKSQVINLNLEMEPGLYCIDGDLTIHSDEFNAEHVTLFMKTGDLTINAGSSLLFTAPPIDADGNCAVSGEGCPPALPAVLIHMPHGNAGNIQINGNSDSTFSGTIYAPESDVKINGNADIGDTVEFGVQVIADTIYVGGTGEIEFNFPGSGLPLGNIMLEVAK